MSLKPYLEELDAIKNELKSLTERRRKLNSRKIQIEEYIKDFLREKDQPGVKYNGIAYRLNEKEKRQPKKKHEQYTQSIDVLKKYGIQNSEKVLEELIEARRGYLIPSDKLEIKKIKR
jgi:transposase